MLYVLDLDNGTYTTSGTDGGILGDGQFNHQPDQIIRHRSGDFLYFTEGANGVLF